MPWGSIHNLRVLDNGNFIVQQRMQKVVEIEPETKGRLELRACGWVIRELCFIKGDEMQKVPIVTKQLGLCGRAFGSFIG